MTLTTSRLAVLAAIVMMLVLAGTFVHFGSETVNCSQFRPEQLLNINLVMHEPDIQSSVYANKIKKLYRDTGYNHDGFPAASSITIYDAQPELSVEFATAIKGLLGKSCFYPYKIDVTLNFVQTIYISKESARFKCEFDALLGHEMKHLDVNWTYFKQNKSLFEHKVKEALEHFVFVYGSGPIYKTGLKPFKKDLSNILNNALDQALQQTDAGIKKYRKVVDTQKEADRVWQLCRW